MATKKHRFQQTADMIGDETVDEYQARNDRKREELHRQAARTTELLRMLATSAAVAVGGIVLLIAFLVGLIGNLHQYIETSSAVLKFLLEWVPRGLGVAVGVWLLTRVYRAYRAWQLHTQTIKRGQAEIDDMHAARKRADKLVDAEYAIMMSEAAERTARAQQIAMTLPVDEQGNALYRDPFTGQVTPFIMQMREHPNLSSYHHSQKNDNTLQPGQQQAALPAASDKPTVEDLARLIEFNSLELAAGRSRTTQEGIISSIEDSHLKIIGGSRMGKSCGAGGLLRQVELTHDPRRLSFALLDLENKTGRLFENSNHLISIGGHRERPIHARTIEEVPVYLHLLAQELEKRDRMTHAQVADRPHILIYLEEFLNLKRQLQNQNNFKAAYPQFLTDFNTIATRGLKLGLHLMICAQVDYADKDMRDSIAQFMGFNMAYGVKPEAARAAGFVNSELLQENYANRKPGKFVIESFSGADIGVAPDFDVRAQIKVLEARATVREELPYELSGAEVIGSSDEERLNRGSFNDADTDIDTPFYSGRVRTTGELEASVKSLSAPTGATTETTTDAGESEGLVLGPNDLEMNEIQAAQFRALYPVLGNIEKSLRMIDSDKGDGKKLGQRYYTHARILIKQYNLAQQKRGR